jgi:hypothetical protein
MLLLSATTTQTHTFSIAKRQNQNKYLHSCKARTQPTGDAICLEEVQGDMDHMNEKLPLPMQNLCKVPRLREKLKTPSC